MPAVGGEISLLTHLIVRYDALSLYGFASELERGLFTMLIGVQSGINMAVNLQLMPAKGMTLPFISYGGSSMISLAYGVGMLLALTRQRPRVEMESMGAARAAHSFA